jgi:hypothetical protein
MSCGRFHSETSKCAPLIRSIISQRIPTEVADRIAGIISARSSVIVSDEALSPETGKGTEFVVVMSDEPQGGIKNRAPRRER